MGNKKIISAFFVSISLFSFIALPLETKAKTIKEFEAEVEKYTKELEEKRSKIAKNDEEVAEIKQKIASIEKQIIAAQQEIEQLQRQIDESNDEIEKKSNESKKIMEYYQISNGNNVYLEYAFGATDITDMIYRVSIVEQLTEYNDKIMKELEQLIRKNEKQQEQLKSKKEELSRLQKELESEKERIDADTASLRVGMPVLEEQIKAAKSNVSYYKSLGCGATEDIQACQYRIQQSSGGNSGGGSVPSTNGFFRPMEYGYIVRGYSWNNAKATGSHMGYDLSSSNKSIPIYPIADGQLYFVGYDNAGALIVKIRHNVGGRYIYSTYAHMSSFSAFTSRYVNDKRGTSESIRNGPMITSGTYLGNMGSTGNSSGPHLHLEITSCDWHKYGGCTWAQYQRSTINPTQYVSIPSRWTNR